MNVMMDDRPSEHICRFRNIPEESAEDVQCVDVWVDPRFDEKEVKRSEILEFGDDCFLLNAVMSPAECDYYISTAEKLGFTQVTGTEKTYRNASRFMVHSDDLARLLWKRISPYLDAITIVDDPHKVHVHGPESLLRGTWKPSGMSCLFRIMRYKPDGHFAPHFDGHFVKSATIRSMKTFLLYMNEDFDGGNTNLIDEKQHLYMNEQGQYCAEEENILFRIKPKVGMVNLFNHHLLHEGEIIRSGCKYIMRTDIMYEKIDGTEVDVKETEALLMAQEAERLESCGDVMAAMEAYRKAFKMSASVATSYGCAP